MSSTLTLTITVDRDMPVSEFAKQQKHTQLPAIANLINGMVSGTVGGSVAVGYAQGVTPAAASGTATITYASIVATDTLVIGGTTFTCVASGANGTTEFNKVTDATATAASLVTAINANTTTSKYCVASNVAGVVTITCKDRSYLGNCLVLAKTGTGIAVVQPTGGAGSTSAITTFR